MLGEQRESAGEASNYSLHKHWLSNYEERRNIQFLSDYPDQSLKGAAQPTRPQSACTHALSCH